MIPYLTEAKSPSLAMRYRIICDLLHYLTLYPQATYLTLSLIVSPGLFYSSSAGFLPVPPAAIMRLL